MSTVENYLLPHDFVKDCPADKCYTPGMCHSLVNGLYCGRPKELHKSVKATETYRLTDLACNKCSKTIWIVLDITQAEDGDGDTITWYCSLECAGVER